MSNKTLEQEAQKRFPIWVEDYYKEAVTYIELMERCREAFRLGGEYIAGRTASANELEELREYKETHQLQSKYVAELEEKLAASSTISEGTQKEIASTGGWIKWGNGGYPKKSGLHNVILREKGESWVAWWNTHKKRFEEAVPEFSDKGVDVDYWQPLPAPLTGGDVSEGQGEDWEPSHLSKGQQEASEIITKWTAKWAGLLTKKNNEIAEMQKRIAELESQLSEGTGCYCLPLSHDPECPKHGNKASQLSEGTAKGGEEHNAVHIGIAEDCRLNSVTGEYEFTRASSQEAEGGELKDIIARIIEQNNNPTATAKIIALVEEHYSSQEAIAKAIAEANHTIDNLQKIIDEQREEMKAIAEGCFLCRIGT